MTDLLRVLMLFVQRGRMLLEAAASAVNQVIAYGNKGVEFVFGGLGFVSALTSLMAVPGGLLFAKLMCPSTEGVAAGCRPVDLPSTRRARDRRVIDFVE